MRLALGLAIVLCVVPACTSLGTPRPGDGGLMSGCTSDSDCTSGFCETVADGSGHMVCAAQGCAECEGVNASGTCVALSDGMTSGTCSGTCSGSYAGPTGGSRACCAHACTCTSGGVCPSH